MSPHLFSGSCPIFRLDPAPDADAPVWDPISLCAPFPRPMSNAATSHKLTR